MKKWLGFLVCLGFLNYRLAMVFYPKIVQIKRRDEK